MTLKMQLFYFAKLNTAECRNRTGYTLAKDWRMIQTFLNKLFFLGFFLKTIVLKNDLEDATFLFCKIKYCGVSESNRLHFGQRLAHDSNFFEQTIFFRFFAQN